MLETITHYFTEFKALANSNPIVASAFGLWGLSAVTFLCRSVPARIWKFISRQSTTTVSLLSQDEVFYDLLDWVTENKMNSLVRTLNFNNGRYGKRDALFSVGYGNMYFFHKGRPFKLSRSKEQANATEFTKETMELTTLGRNKDVFKDLFKTVTTPKTDDHLYMPIYYYQGAWGSWERGGKIYKRSLDTVTVARDVEDTLLHFIDNFEESKEWHIEHGIPYRTGILLYGPPGTGKTSLIKALCTEYDKPLYILSLGSLSDRSLENALKDIPPGCIVAVEDIDSQSITHERAESGEGDSNKSVTGPTLSGVLNAIDGASSGEDRIIIATTNHIDKLDKALVREGRFDLKLELGYVTEEMFRDYIKRFDENVSIPNTFRMKPEVAMCELQKSVLEHREELEKVVEIYDQTRNHSQVEENRERVESTIKKVNEGE